MRSTLISMADTSFDIRRAREHTPGCESVLHFNNAGAALMPEPVLQAMINHLQLEAEIGGYEAADMNQSLSDRVYDAAASLLDCSREEIAIVESATRAWDVAFYSIPFKADDRVLLSIAEYGSNCIACQQFAKKTGITIEPIPNDERGQVSIAALREVIDERVKLIAITHVPSHGGLVNPVAEIGAVAREAGVLYLVDACQSVGQMPVKVSEIGCDLLSFTGRKFLRGPRGTGGLYIRRKIIETLDPPFLDIHAAKWIGNDRYEVSPNASRFENWEYNYAAKIGLGVAIDYALAWGLDAICGRVFALAEHLRSCLGAMRDVKVQDLGDVLSGIVSFTIDGCHPDEARQALAARRMNIWVSSPRSAPLDMQARGLDCLIRASVHYYNSEEEVGRFCEAIASLSRTT
jgi:cysteine desulfurase / selenocysteine lyase